jgi:predicted ArsR family transcriptional regulator
MADGAKKILSKIQQRKTLEAISSEIGVSKATLNARLDALIHQGYLEKISYDSGCSMCPMKCSSPTCGSYFEFFTLTDKGRKMIGI